MGGTRYDAAVSLGHTLVAPTPGSQSGFFTPGMGLPTGKAGAAGSMGFNPFLMGPPAGLRSKMEGLAQSWKDSGKIDAGQFTMIMDGIQTGHRPDGAEGMFSPGQYRREMGPRMDMGMMGPMGADGQMGMPDGMPPAWLMGPGMGDGMMGEGMDSSFMVFDPSQGGWLREDSGAGFWGEEGGLGEEEEETALEEESSDETVATETAETSSESTTTTTETTPTTSSTTTSTTTP
jgi:hypothetical protein